MASRIQCLKCAAAYAAAQASCAKCGGTLARVCSDCGTASSLVKNFCDKCGKSLTNPAPASAPRPASPGPDIPATAVFRLPTPGEALAGGAMPAFPPSGPLPPAKKAEPLGSPAPAPAQPASARPAPESLDDLWKPSAPPATSAAPTKPPAAKRALSAVLNAIAALAGVALAGFGLWRWQQSQRPEVVVPRLAARYLDELRSQDYAGAYAMFSEAAKQSCTLDEFRAIRDTTAWTWSDLRVVHQEPGALLLAYTLSTPGKPDRTDHVLFTQEGDRWTRPYNWVLMRQVEESFDRGDADRGLLLAQSAATVNPRDPMAWGYLCEAAYYRHSPADAEARCVRALELADIYPSDLTPKSLYHLHAILADTYSQSLGRPDKAVEQFAQMLSFPNISPEDQCQILLARAQAYQRLSRPGEALADVDAGARLCTNPGDLAFVQKMRAALRPPSP